MALLNYTTTVAADRTATQITAKLAGAGATQILTDYAAGRPTGIWFALDTIGGRREYRLPVDVAACEKVLRRQRDVPARYATTAQAERVAWRILKDWIEAQLAIIETQMVAVDQVFLPYMLIGQSTVYALYRDQQLALDAAVVR